MNESNVSKAEYLVVCGALEQLRVFFTDKNDFTGYYNDELEMIGHLQRIIDEM